MCVCVCVCVCLCVKGPLARNVNRRYGNAPRMSFENLSSNLNRTGSPMHSYAELTSASQLHYESSLQISICIQIIRDLNLQEFYDFTLANCSTFRRSLVTSKNMSLFRDCYTVKFQAIRSDRKISRIVLH